MIMLLTPRLLVAVVVVLMVTTDVGVIAGKLSGPIPKPSPNWNPGPYAPYGSNSRPKNLGPYTPPSPNWNPRPDAPYGLNSWPKNLGPYTPQQPIRTIIVPAPSTPKPWIYRHNNFNNNPSTFPTPWNITEPYVPNEPNSQPNDLGPNTPSSIDSVVHQKNITEKFFSEEPPKKPRIVPDKPQDPSKPRSNLRQTRKKKKKATALPQTTTTTTTTTIDPRFVDELQKPGSTLLSEPVNFKPPDTDSRTQ